MRERLSERSPTPHLSHGEQTALAGESQGDEDKGRFGWRTTILISSILTGPLPAPTRNNTNIIYGVIKTEKTNERLCNYYVSVFTCGGEWRLIHCEAVRSVRQGDSRCVCEWRGYEICFRRCLV